MLKIPEKQIRELGPRIKLGLARNGQAARQISQSSLFHPPHSHYQFRMRLNGTPWSKNVLRVALTNIPVTFSIALAKDAERVFGSTGSRLTFHRQFADQKALGPYNSSWPRHWARKGSSRNPTKPPKLSSEIQTVFNINGLRHRGHQ